MDISNLIERSGAIRKFYSLPDLSIKDWAFLMSISSFRSIKKGDIFIGFLEPFLEESENDNYF